MSNLREAYSATAYAGLGWDENQEKAIDRVAASGKATSLGISLWRSKYQLESRSYQKAHALALEIFAKRYRDSLRIAQECVWQALREYVDMSLCSACNGQGGLLIDQKWATCPVCDGQKYATWGDKLRSARMGMSQQRVRALAHKINWLALQFSEADRAVNYQLNIELERFS